MVAHRICLLKTSKEAGSKSDVFNVIPSLLFLGFSILPGLAGQSSRTEDTQQMSRGGLGVILGEPSPEVVEQIE